MKFVVTILLTALLSFAAGMYLPWWIVAPVSFLLAFFINQKAGWAFLASFLALTLLWGALAFWIDLQNAHLLARRIATLIGLNGNHMALIALSAVVAGLVGGIAAMSGSYLRKYLRTDGSPKVKEFLRKLPGN